MSGDEIEDGRARRRDRACVATGALTGAGLGVLAGTFLPPGGVAFAVFGAAVGGVVSRFVALRISPDDWDPLFSRRSYVGTRSPDDDIASST